MAFHPSVSWSFDDLSRELEDRVSRGLVRSTTAPDAPRLKLYCYTNSCVNDRAWDDVTVMARGIVLDYEAKVVRSRPFPKFFNYGERSLLLPDETFCAYDKIDGSLAITFFDGVRWRTTTKGSFVSTQAQWAEEWLREHCNLHYTLKCGDTYLAETVYTENRIVVRYPFEGLVMLGAYAEDGREYSYEEVAMIASGLGARVAQKHDYESFEAMRDAVAGFAADREGYVVHFPVSGYRVKVKGAEYLRIHRLISRVTPLALWDVMANGGDVDAIRRDIPEEFWGDFDAIRRILIDRLDGLLASVESWSSRLADKTNKEIGLMLHTLPEDARSFIFARRSKGDAMMADPKTRRAVFQTFRPTGNVLEGYTPSDTIRRVEAE